jgi:signal transduction histidine kinase
MRARTGRLQHKFFIALLIVGIVPGAVALIVTYLSSTASLKSAIGAGFQEIARSTAIRIAVTVDTEIDRAVRLALVPFLIRDVVETANHRYDGTPSADLTAQLAREQADRTGPSLLRLDPQRQATTAYLQEWARQSSHYIRVVIADLHGALVVSTDATTPYLHAQQEWWQEAIHAPAGTAYVSTLRLDAQIQDYVFDVAVPILDPKGTKTIGVVGLVIRREVLMNTILAIRVGTTGHGMLLDTTGTPLICPVLPPTAHLIPDQLLAQLTQEGPLWFVADNDAHGGRHAIVGAAPVRLSHPLTPLSLGGQRWFAFVRQQPEETYAPIYALLVKVGLIGFGLVGMLASLGFVVGRRTVAPILALKEATQRLQEEVMALSTPHVEQWPTSPSPLSTITTGDEIEDLARTFHTMRCAMENSVRTIHAQQTELIRREKLASVGQLLAALAHDLRNPLGVIRSSAQVVLDIQQGDQVKREVAQYIIEEVDRLTDRIHDFLRYARQKPPEPTSIPAQVLIRSALRQWEAQGKHESVHVTQNVAENVPMAFVDPEQVKEALVNLLMNAREAVPQEGTIRVTADTDPEGRLVIEIADTGCGIPTANLARIFEPFFTTKEYGTGLGLTNVKRLIEDNGGTIEVFSQVGEGTRFVLRLPCAPIEPRE